MFPRELWEQILENVDAVSLMRLRTTSLTWNDIITRHLQNSDAWYKQCKLDIPEKYCSILLENSMHLNKLLVSTNIDYYEKERYNDKIWLTIYKAWLKWNNPQYLNVSSINEIEPVPEHRPSEFVTCCHVLGELLAVGTNEGYVNIFNFKTSQLVFRVDMYKTIFDVKLCLHGKSLDKILLIIRSIYSKCTVWDVTDQKKSMVTSGDAICAGYGAFCIAQLPDKFYIYNAAEKCRKISVVSPLIETLMNRLTEIKNTQMIINKNQLCLWSNTSLYSELDLKDVDQSPADVHILERKYVSVPKHQKIRKHFLFNPNVAFCVTEKGYFGISVYESAWKLYNTHAILDGVVTAVHFHVKVLILGLDSGDVCIFSIKNESALKSINFKSAKTCRLQLSSDPIVSINTMEISGDQTLLVATKRTVHHVKLS